MPGIDRPDGSTPPEKTGAAPEQAEAVLSAPLTKKRIQAAHPGVLMPLAGPIHVVDYDPVWPRLFAREAGRVRNALGERILRLEYVGSTSVPGLAAKPKIDMLLVVADSADEQIYIPALQTADYVLQIREPGWYQHRMFKGPDRYQSPCRLRWLPGDRAHAAPPQLVTRP